MMARDDRADLPSLALDTHLNSRFGALGTDKNWIEKPIARQTGRLAQDDVTIGLIE
jgi:hypothetical protein